MEKQKRVPALRFPEFEGEWEMKRLGEVGVFIGGGTPSTKNANYWNGEIPWISSSDLTDENINEINTTRFITKEAVFDSATKLIPSNSILIVSRVGVGKVAINKTELCTSQDFTSLVPSDGHVSFLAYQIKLKTNSLLGFNQGTSIKGFVKSDLELLEISIAILPEQQKIATFLTSVDEKLTQLKKKKTLLEQYKKGAMQLLLSGFSGLKDEQDGINPPILQSSKSRFRQLRFKDDNGNEYPEWEEKRLGEIATRKTTKNKEENTNVLTISAQLGLISQLEFFNKSVSAKDVSGYYLITKGDFAYNKSYSAGYPMGAIKCLKRYEAGVVSTLYICFSFNIGINLSFMEQYFETGIHNKEIEKVAQEGARNHGLLNIGLSDFFSTELFLPSLPEQTKIANFLFALDEKITYCGGQIEKMEQWKKGLLQGMFC